MKKEYSIAQARSNLPTVVREAELGLEIDLTRRGKPVAVVMSHREYERLRSRRSHFRDAYEAFLTRFSPDAVGLDDAWFESLRDRRPGRRVAP